MTRIARLLLLMTLLDAVGSAGFVVGGTAYFLQAAELSGHEIGLGLSLSGTVAVLAAIPAGRLSDYVDRRALMIWLSLVSAAAYACYLFVSTFAGYLVVVAIVGALLGAADPIRNTLVFAVTPPGERVRMQARMRTVYNVGFAVGSGLSSLLLIVQDSRVLSVAILANAMSYLGVALLARALPAPEPGAAPGGSAPAPRERTRSGVDRALLASLPQRLVGARRWWPLGLLAVLNGLLLMTETFYRVGLPLWVVTSTTAPRWVIGVVVLEGSLAVVLLQVWLSRGADTLWGSVRLLRRASLVLSFACLVYSLSASLSTKLTVICLLLGGLVQVMAEIFASAASWGLPFAIGPASRQGAVQGVFAAGSQLQMTVGPIVVTGVLISFDAWGWMLLAALAALPACAAGPVARKVARLDWADRVPAPAPARVPASAHMPVPAPARGPLRASAQRQSQR